jgi:hypothetical protein
MARSMIPLLLLCMAFLEGATALHLCVDRLFNDTQGRHNDGLPHLNPTEEATWMTLLPRKLGSKAEFDWLALYRSLTRGGDTTMPPRSTCPRHPCTMFASTQAPCTGRASRPTLSTFCTLTPTASPGASGSRQAYPPLASTTVAGRRQTANSVGIS